METTNNLNEEVKQLLAKPYSGVMIGEKKYSFGDDGLDLTPNMQRAVVTLALLGQLNGDNFVSRKDLVGYLKPGNDPEKSAQIIYKLMDRLMERVGEEFPGLIVKEKGYGFKLKTESQGQISLIDKNGELVKIAPKAPGAVGEGTFQDSYVEDISTPWGNFSKRR